MIQKMAELEGSAFFIPYPPPSVWFATIVLLSTELYRKISKRLFPGKKAVYNIKKSVLISGFE